MLAPQDNLTAAMEYSNLFVCLMGLGIVFFGLICIILLTYLMANGTSQPATESLVATLRGTPRDTGLDLSKMSAAAAHFRKVAARLQAEGSLDPKVLHVDTNTLLYQVPGGMLSNLISQLKQAGKEDRYYDVLEEIPRVRKDYGYPPLVTPSSQIVGTQAVMETDACPVSSTTSTAAGSSSSPSSAALSAAGMAALLPPLSFSCTFSSIFCITSSE